jgi:hypothetical protein
MGFAEMISFPCLNHMRCVHVRGIRIKESKKHPGKRRKKIIYVLKNRISLWRTGDFS